METSLNGPDKYFEANGFKSYYVVWKLEKRGRPQKKRKSLNRTM